MQSPIMTVCQHKGGVGKTTTALNLAGYLSQKAPVLLIDMDPQENATIGLGAESELESGTDTIVSVIKGDKSIEEIILPTQEENIFIAPGHYSMTYLDIELSSRAAREWILDKALENVQQEFGYIIIDTQPHLGIGTLMAAVAADLLLVPMKLDFYSLRGLNILLRFMQILHDDLELQPEIRFVCTMKRKTNLSEEAETAIRKRLAGRVYKTNIPLNVTLEEAPSHSQTIAQYAPNSSGGQAYQELAEELARDLHAMEVDVNG